MPAGAGADARAAATACCRRSSSRTPNGVAWGAARAGAESVRVAIAIEPDATGAGCIGEAPGGSSAGSSTR